MRPTAYLYNDEKELSSIELGDKSLSELFSLLKENGFTPTSPEVVYPNTPTLTSTLGDHYYELFSVSNFFQPAKDFAENRIQGTNRGHILTVSSEEENKFITDILTKNNVGSVWLGGQDTDTEGIWKWIGSGNTFWNQYEQDGTDHYTNWRDDEPNNTENEDCMTLNREGWNDVPCDTERAALIIEYGGDKHIINLQLDQPEKSEL